MLKSLQLVVWCSLFCLVSLSSQAENFVPAATNIPAHNADAARGSFTGPDVPAVAPLLGDFVAEGVFTPGKRTDIPQLLGVLQQMGARDYMHMVWNEKRYPSAWEDFQLMAPEFQKANIGLWLYLIPPSRTGSSGFTVG